MKQCKCCEPMCCDQQTSGWLGEALGSSFAEFCAPFAFFSPNLMFQNSGCKLAGRASVLTLNIDVFDTQTFHNMMIVLYRCNERISFSCTEVRCLFSATCHAFGKKHARKVPLSTLTLFNVKFQKQKKSFTICSAKRIL